MGVSEGGNSAVSKVTYEFRKVMQGRVLIQGKNDMGGLAKSHGQAIVFNV